MGNLMKHKDLLIKLVYGDGKCVKMQKNKGLKFAYELKGT